MKYLNTRIAVALILPILLVASFFGLKTLGAFDLADTDDIFQVITPVPNSTVSGIRDVSLSVFDDDQESVQFSARLFDENTCFTDSFGNISTETALTSSSLETANLEWNTGVTQSVSPLEDGSYCLKVCVAMLNGQVPYSTCNSRVVSIFNDNDFPTITSTPNQTTIESGAGFSYQVTATDPDNDVLSYTLTKTPDFLAIDQVSGLIQNSAPPSVIDDADTTYEVEVEVSDGKTGFVKQAFTLTVTAPLDTTTPDPEPNPEPTPDSFPEEPDDDNENPDSFPEDPIDDQDDGEIIDISFTNPTPESIFNGAENSVVWEIQGENGFNELVLSYVQVDGSEDAEFVNIVTITTRDTMYNWDVSELPSGIYALRLQAFKDGQVLYQVVSDRFQVAIADPDNDSDNGDDQVSSIPIILNVVPVNADRINTVDFDNVISGEFIASLGNDIDPDSFVIALDEIDIRDVCQVTATDFTCNLIDTPADGRHVISISVSDSSGQTAEFESSFTLGENIDTEDENVALLGQNVPRSALLWVLIICGAILLVLFIPWLLYLMWSGGNGTRYEEVSESDPDYYADLNAAAAPIDYSQFNDPLGGANQSGNYVYQPELEPLPTYQPAPDTTLAGNTNGPIEFYEPEATDS